MTYLEQIFKNVYDEHYETLLAYAFKYTSNIPESQDVVIELFIELWNKGESYYTAGHVGAWLQKKLHYRLIDSKRKQWSLSMVDHMQKRYVKGLTDDERKEEWSLLSDYTDIKDDKEERLTEIEKAIEALPISTKTVLKLYYNGSTTEDVMKVLDKSRQNVLNQKQYGIKLIKQYIHAQQTG